MRRSPCDLYLKFLIVHPDYLTDEAIERRAFEERLDSGGARYIAQLRQTCIPPQPFRPTDQYHDASTRFLVKHKIRALFFPDDAVRTGLRILHTARAKEFVEAMVLAGAPNIRIGQEVTRRFGFPCGTGDINSFKKFFWDIDSLDMTERRTLVQMRATDIHHLDDADPRKAAYKAALKRASYKDPRRVAAELPNSPVSAVIIGMYMGDEPSDIDLGLVLHDLRRLALLRASEQLRDGGPFSMKNFKDLTGGLKDLKEIMDDSATPAEELEKQIQTLRLKTRPSSAPVLHQLTGGQHTMDLQPKPVYEEEAEDDPDAGAAATPGGDNDPE